MLDIAHKQTHAGTSSLSWLEAGHGPATMVLLHGIGSNAESWAAQLVHFAKTYRVIAWNAPGYAQSDVLSASAPIPTSYANALKTLLDEADAKKILLVGHSLGALIAARFTLLHPDRVEKLILSAPAGGYNCQPDQPLPQTLQQRLDDIVALGPRGMADSRAARTLTAAADARIIDRAKDAMASVSVRGYQDAVHLLAAGDLRQDLSQLNLSFSVICGTADRTTPIDKVDSDTSVAKRQQLLPLEGAAHASYLEFPVLFNQTLEKILGEIK